MARRAGGMTMRTASLCEKAGSIVCTRCAIADSPTTRMRGLLGRHDLAEDEGMFFTRTGSIHTFFMRFPIDVVFCDRDLRVLEVVRELRPWRIASRRGAKVVVELPAGTAAFEPGDQLLLGDAA